MKKNLLSSLNWFISVNIRACNWIEARLPASFHPNLHERHKAAVLQHIAALDEGVVVDIGGGKKSPFLRGLQKDGRVRVYGVDISEEELSGNILLDGKVVCDASAPLPIATDSVDIVVTRSVVEHLANTDVFIRESRRIVKPGGVCIHVLPCKFSPFSILNQLLPNKVAQRLLFLFFPHWQSACGFKAYYRNCHQPRFSNLHRDFGFKIEVQESRYYQSIYFRFLVPVYLISLTYDLIVWKLGLETLACQTFVVARKTENS